MSLNDKQTNMGMETGRSTHQCCQPALSLPCLNLCNCKNNNSSQAPWHLWNAKQREIYNFEDFGMLWKLLKIHWKSNSIPPPFIPCRLLKIWRCENLYFMFFIIFYLYVICFTGVLRFSARELQICICSHFEARCCPTASIWSTGAKICANFCKLRCFTVVNSVHHIKVTGFDSHPKEMHCMAVISWWF